MDEVSLTICLRFNEDGSVAVTGEVDSKLLTAGEQVGFSATAQTRSDLPAITAKWLDKILIAKSKEIEQKLIDQAADIERRKKALERMRK